MKNLLILSLLLWGTLLNAQSTKTKKFLKPINGKKVSVFISNKNSTYYALSSKEAVKLNIEGPGKLKIITRARFTPSQSEKIDYAINYKINDGKSSYFYTKGAMRSKNATFIDGKLGVPGQSYEFEITLERGMNNIEFKPKENSIPIIAKYIFTPISPKKQKWIAYSPLQPSQPVDVVSKETITTYNRFSLDKPLLVEINGPTQLRVLTRIENHYNMKGTINYRLQVRENGKVINTYQLSSKHSDIAVYKENNTLVPGKAREFIINVPKGNHKYEIIPLDKDKNTVLGRFLLPEKDVKL